MGRSTASSALAAFSILLLSGCITNRVEGDELTWTTAQAARLSGWVREPNVEVHLFAATVANPSSAPTNVSPTAGSGWAYVGTDLSDSSGPEDYFGYDWYFWAVDFQAYDMWFPQTQQTAVVDRHNVPTGSVLREGRRARLSAFVDMNGDGQKNGGDYYIVSFLAPLTSDYDGDGKSCLKATGNPNTEHYDADCMTYYLTSRPWINLIFRCGADGLSPCNDYISPPGQDLACNPGLTIQQVWLGTGGVANQCKPPLL